MLNPFEEDALIALVAMSNYIDNIYLIKEKNKLKMIHADIVDKETGELKVQTIFSSVGFNPSVFTKLPEGEYLDFYEMVISTTEEDTKTRVLDWKKRLQDAEKLSTES